MSNKNYVLGPAMIPDKRMYREANEVVNIPHEVGFEAETIAKVREKFHKENRDNRVNINHDGVLVSGVLLTRSFLLDADSPERQINEFRDLPDGTWMIEYEISNELIWDSIKSGKLKGFSVEGIFNYQV